MGYLVVTAVLVVTFGRIGDMFGRVRMYNAGFAVFTAASIALSLTPGHRRAPAAMWLIVFRIVQGIGGALLMANSTAILTDAFPADERGRAIGIIDGRRHRRVVHRPDRRRHPRRHRLAAGVLGQRAVRRVRHRLGLRQAARARRAAPRPHRLVGQRHLRRRADHDPDRHHLRPAALRRPQHGLDRPVRCCSSSSAASPCSSCSCIIEPRVERADVPPRAVPDPRLRDGQCRLPAVVDRARRPAVHADHLVAGHLAAAARLQLRGHAAVGRHLHAPADGRLPDRRSRRGLAVRPLRRAAVRHRRHAARRAVTSAADAAAGQLHLLGVRRAAPDERHRHGPVRRAERHRHHEHRARRASAARRRACGPRSRTPAWCCRSACSSA